MLSVCILAGGTSQRMGRDKALISFLGRPLIRQVVERVRPIASEIIIITNDPEKYQFLKLPIIKDKVTGAGALAGLFTALSAAASNYVAVLACDLPFVNIELIRTELDLLLAGSADVVIPQSASGFEPLHAIYNREACLPWIERALVDKQKRLISWFDKVNVRVITREEVGAFDPDHTAFVNINTPEELVHAEEIARAQIDGIGRDQKDS
jgi:molybdopterin-guanine dinucleotide biosynthesis protein A